jgi:hypothetical protein
VTLSPCCVQHPWSHPSVSQTWAHRPRQSQQMSPQLMNAGGTRDLPGSTPRFLVPNGIGSCLRVACCQPGSAGGPLGGRASSCECLRSSESTRSAAGGARAGRGGRGTSVDAGSGLGGARSSEGGGGRSGPIWRRCAFPWAADVALEAAGCFAFAAACASVRFNIAHLAGVKLATSVTSRKIAAIWSWSMAENGYKGFHQRLILPAAMPISMTAPEAARATRRSCGLWWPSPL